MSDFSKHFREQNERDDCDRELLENFRKASEELIAWLAKHEGTWNGQELENLVGELIGVYLMFLDGHPEFKEEGEAMIAKLRRGILGK